MKHKIAVLLKTLCYVLIGVYRKSLFN